MRRYEGCGIGTPRAASGKERVSASAEVWVPFRVRKSTTILLTFQMFRKVFEKKTECLPFSVANDSIFSG